jgi:hypothetical protein
LTPHSVSGSGQDMAATESATVPTPAADAAERSRERWFRVVLLGLLILVLGFTALLMANFFYPCEPAAGSVVQPPLGECVGFLSPWIGVVAAGIVIAGIGYLRVG